MESKFKFFEESNTAGAHPVTEIKQPESVIEPVQQQSGQNQYRYRVEQTLIMKINGVVSTHGTTKQEYLVQKNFVNGGLDNLGFELVENVLQFNPKQLESAIHLVCEIDKIKSQVQIIPDKSSGKIKTIKSKAQAFKAWDKFKEKIAQDFSFVQSAEEQESLKALLDLTENQLNDDTLLLSDYEARIFYDIIFDRYLFGKITDEPFQKLYLSNLFAHNLVTLNVAPFVHQQSAEAVSMRYIGVLDKQSYDKDHFVDLYDERFKPQIGYSFSDYNYALMSNCTYNTADNIITEADLHITEEVKNNVELIIDYRLKLVDL